MKYLKLSNSNNIPVLGFGTAKIKGRECQKTVEAALKIGYRHIDTAFSYDNQREVAYAYKHSGIRRESIFITSKVFHNDLHPQKVKYICSKCLTELQTDYIDLFLIHWPNRCIPLEKTLIAFNELYKEGLIKAIGVSNFTIDHIRDCIQYEVPIMNNQIEYHPSLNQQELKEFCNRKGITVTAYSPLAQGQDLKLQPIKIIAKKRKKSAAQIIINWIVSKNMITIPKSVRKEKMLENWNSLNFSLSKKEIAVIDSMDNNKRLVNPDFSEFDY
jgi:diketogulonate reductase-like aldo/keto reductase